MKSKGLRLAFGLGCLTSVAFAQFGTSGGMTTEATDLRLNITNALVTTLQNSRRINLDLKWDFLPDAPDSTLQDTYQMSWKDARNGLWGEWTFANRDLASGTAWKNLVGKLDDRSKTFLGLVLNGGKPLALTPDTDVAETIRKTIGNLQSATGSMKPWGPVDRFPPQILNPETHADFGTLANYRFCLAMLQALVESRGMGVRIDEPSGKLKMSGPKFLRDEIVWTLRAYRVNYYGENAPVPQAYTLSLSATVRNVKFTLIGQDSSSTNQISLKLTAGLLREIEVPGVKHRLLAMLPYTVADGSLTVEKAQPLPGASDLSKVKISPSSTGAILNIIGGVGVGSLAESFFASNPDARLFAGGMIGDGETQRVLGVNMPLGQDSLLGLLFGIVPEESNSLFIGPSVEVGVLTLGVGGRIFGRADGDTTATLAGVLSVDLAKVFSRPSTAEPIPFKRNDSSVFWKSFPTASSDQVVATFGFSMKGSLDRGRSFRIFQIGEDGVAIKDGKLLTLPWCSDGRIYTVSTLLPKGLYALELPPNVNVFYLDNPLTPIDSGIGTPKLYRIDLSTGKTVVFNYKLEVTER
jgi:hypothetical protein